MSYERRKVSSEEGPSDYDIEKMGMIRKIMDNNLTLSDDKRVALFDKLYDKSLTELKIYLKVFK